MVVSAIEIQVTESWCCGGLTPGFPSNATLRQQVLPLKIWTPPHRQLFMDRAILVRMGQHFLMGGSQTNRAATGLQ